MKVKALKKFEGIRDAERDIYPKEGDIWEVSEERADFLFSKGVVELIIDGMPEEIEEPKEEKKVEEEIKEEAKPKKAKKNKKK